MGEIKRAREIALEKANKLGALSAEELKKQKEEKCTLIGHALADKYLGGLDAWQLDIELDKYNIEERTLVRQAAVSKLASSIELGNYESLDRVIEGIFYLKQKGTTGDIKCEINQLFQEYKGVEQKENEEIESSARNTLHQLSISGSAIEAVNPKAIIEGQQGFDRFTQRYRETLELLKQKLIQLPPE